MNRTIFLIYTFTLSYCLYAQSKSNFELAEVLVESSIDNLVSEIDESSEYALNIKSSSDYLVFENKILNALKNNNINIVPEGSSEKRLNFFLEEINIFYPEIFRDGIFGNYLVKREGKIKVSFFISDEIKVGEVKNFNETIQDSVLHSDIRRLENVAYSFTSPELPDEPIFASSLEPIIAIGSAAVAVYLLFNIRSK